MHRGVDTVADKSAKDTSKNPPKSVVLNPSQMSKDASDSGSTVQRSAYRQPVTAKGLKAIEDGSLTWLDDEMYNNLNTSVLEQYLEEYNL